MSAFNWIKRLRKDESGNVLIIGAAVMPMLMGSAALAIDTVQLTLWKRQLQRAADSAAIAGAYALAQGAPTDTAVDNDIDEHVDYDLEENEQPMLTQKLVTTGTFSNGVVSNTPCAAAPPACFREAVQVELTGQRSLPFIQWFTKTPNTFRVDAVAALATSGEFCMVSLFNGNEPGVVASGNAALRLGCGIITNSRATNALDAGGSSGIEATPVAAVGGIEGSSHFIGETKLQPYSAPIKDPFANVPNPTAPADCSTNALSVPNGATVTLNLADDPFKGCYASWNIQGKLIIVPGTAPDQDIAYVNNGLLDLKGEIEADGVTIALLGDDSDMKQNGGGLLDLTAPKSGARTGIAMFRDRNAANVTIKINGGADTDVTGAFYLSSSDVWINGNANINATCLQLVGRILTFKGGGNITNSCPPGSGAGAFRQTVVRLVK